MALSDRGALMATFVVDGFFFALVPFIFCRLAAFIFGNSHVTFVAMVRDMRGKGIKMLGTFFGAVWLFVGFLLLLILGLARCYFCVIPSVFFYCYLLFLALEFQLDLLIVGFQNVYALFLKFFPVSDKSEQLLFLFLISNGKT